MKTITEYFLIYQFAYIFFFISLISIIFSIFIRSRILKLICLVIFSLFVAMGLTEFILSSKIKTKIFFLEHPKNIFILEKQTIRPAREIHVVKKNGQKRKYADRAPYADETVIYDYVANRYPNGFRYTRCNLKSKQNYIFLGCSYTFGAGLDDDQTLPYYFSKLMNFENNVLNCGISGRSTNTAISIVESDIVDKFVSNDSQTKYFIYYMIQEHVYRNFRVYESDIDNWLYKNGKWERVSQPFGRLKIVFARSYIFNKIFLNFIEKHNMPYYEEYMIKSLQRIKETAEIKYKSKLIVVLGKSCHQNPLFINEIKKTDLDLVFLPEAFDRIEYKIKKDGHPSAKANEELANILIGHIQNNESRQK
ncbi:MAG: hypothetical protein PHR82_00730 [Endomicrobiaceae bacterium]|nr:hypothetical protein [Endomicrobiaceae bacterium]